jgi:hypothetical protein
VGAVHLLRDGRDEEIEPGMVEALRALQDLRAS